MVNPPKGENIKTPIIKFNPASIHIISSLNVIFLVSTSVLKSENHSSIYYQSKMGIFEQLKSVCPLK